MAVGTHDTNITGPKAHRVTFRQTCSNAMLANAVGPELLKHGKKWYFLTADYAFGTDAHERFKKILLAHGGTEVGNDLHPLGADRLLVVPDQGAQHRRRRAGVLQLRPQHAERGQSRGPARAQQEDDLRRHPVRQRRRGRPAGRRHRRLDLGLRLGTRGRRRRRRRSTPRSSRASTRSTGASTSATWPAKNIIDRLNARRHDRYREARRRRSRTSTTTPARRAARTSASATTRPCSGTYAGMIVPKNKRRSRERVLHDRLDASAATSRPSRARTPTARRPQKIIASEKIGAARRLHRPEGLARTP